MPATNKYGSIEEGASPPAVTNYEESYDTQYIVSTAEEKRRRCLNGFFPVMIFVLLMGSIVYAITRDFSHLYPWSHVAHKGNRANGGGGGASDVVTTSSSASNTPYVSHNSHSDITQESSGTSSSSCSLYSKCSDLGLTGQCCPTKSGIRLECCK